MATRSGAGSRALEELLIAPDHGDEELFFTLRREVLDDVESTVRDGLTAGGGAGPLPVNPGVASNRAGCTSSSHAMPSSATYFATSPI